MVSADVCEKCKRMKKCSDYKDYRQPFFLPDFFNVRTIKGRYRRLLKQKSVVSKPIDFPDKPEQLALKF
jgi:hypothetical protein